MLKAWLSLFRVPNLLTVPGDVLVGAAAVGRLTPSHVTDIAYLALASVLMYAYGLVDNDIVGAATDPKSRPIASGAISVGAAKVARTLCLCFAVLALNFGHGQFAVLIPLTISIIVYNRKKMPLLMGAARAFNVLLGGIALIPAAIWLVYIAAVTRYSERETVDPSNGRKVACLVYALLLMQSGAIAFYLLSK